MERLECEIEMEKERWRWRRVSGGIRMGDRVSGKIRMGDGWIDYKRRKKWAGEGDFFFERKFWMFERVLGDWRKIWEKENTKRERILKMMGVQS